MKRETTPIIGRPVATLIAGWSARCPVYDPSKAREGAVEPGETEVHRAFHDDLFPDTGNVAPPFSFSYHLVFEDVRIEQFQVDYPEDWPCPGPPRGRIPIYWEGARWRGSTGPIR